MGLPDPKTSKATEHGGTGRTGELPLGLSPCCWKPLQQDGDIRISERTCDQSCDHEHHNLEDEQPGIHCVAMIEQSREEKERQRIARFLRDVLEASTHGASNLMERAIKAVEENKMDSASLREIIRNGAVKK